jgi:UDP:flavonoid glycosyltransferase YjiC (YdhE family)
VRVLQPLIAFAGHTQPQLAITRRLVQRGHEVRILAHRAARERVQRAGAQVIEFKRTYPDMDMASREADTLRDWEPRTRIAAMRRVIANALFAFVDNAAQDCAEALQEWSADVVVFDWMLIGAAIAAERAGLPAVAIGHCPLTLPIAGVPPMGFGLRPVNGPAGALRDRLLGAGSRRVLANAGLPPVNAARSQLGLAPLEHWEDQLLGAHAICMMTAPELDFASRGALPANMRYVGPAFEPYQDDWTPPWPQENTDPLVLIGFSTSYMNQRALVQRVLDAIDGLPVRALLTTGPALDAAVLRLPANTRAEMYVAHRAVMPHTKLVITHAGWQTVNAALADGVPLVCIPGGRDQPDNAARVVAANAGVKARKGISPRRLRRLIAQALEDTALRQGAQAMASALARSDGAVAVVDQLERMVPLARSH